MPPPLHIHPPLLNSASPWATTHDDLRNLLTHPSTGAITLPTSPISAFPHSDAAHRYLFFDPATASPSPGTSSTPAPSPAQLTPHATSSLNSLGYSPTSLVEYLSILATLAVEHPPAGPRKLCIISVAGTPAEVARAYRLITAASSGGSLSCFSVLAMEINLSCPNIPGRPPPAHSPAALDDYLSLLPSATDGDFVIPIGVKVPPYTYDEPVEQLVGVLAAHADKISFVTAVNTLGSCLVYTDGDDELTTPLPGSGMGGMAGTALQPLALGNVRMLKTALRKVRELAHVRVIGVGGVGDALGYKRMRRAGADYVALATALGRRGTEVFSDIEKGLGGAWEL